MNFPLWMEVGRRGVSHRGLENRAEPDTVALPDSDHRSSTQAGTTHTHTHTHTHTPNSLSETSASLCLVQWVKFAPPPPPSKVLSLNLSQVVNVPLALRECEKWVEGKGAEGALEGPGAPETWPF